MFGTILLHALSVFLVCGHPHGQALGYNPVVAEVGPEIDNFEDFNSDFDSPFELEESLLAEIDAEEDEEFEEDEPEFEQEEFELDPESEPWSETYLPAEWELRAVNLDRFRKDTLNYHNQYRAKHQVSPLTLDSKLSALAQEWADHLAEKSLFKHRPDSKFGENIFYGSGKTWTAQDAVAMWYNEVQNYDFSTHKKKNPRKMIGHFTQLVWKGSKKLGVGMAYNPKTKNTYVVCNYDPPGNYQGSYPKNVFPAA